MYYIRENGQPSSETLIRKIETKQNIANLDINNEKLGVSLCSSYQIYLIHDNLQGDNYLFLMYPHINYWILRPTISPDTYTLIRCTYFSIETYSFNLIYMYYCMYNLYVCWYTHIILPYTIITLPDISRQLKWPNHAKSSQLQNDSSIDPNNRSSIPFTVPTNNFHPTQM